ncbi:MAG: hypothetical protein U0807_11880 [Candidatus Binatia bacterium]
MSAKEILIAGAAATLFLTGAFAARAAQPEGSEQVVCSGVNACKGQGSCKTEHNACAGKNGCKGQGNSKMSAAECTAKGGKVMKTAEAK